ncbi:hypothetical protein POL68_07205 [Stigmatella sp. ncwal1]|uniref:Uncharacterized protein n=1 Tax=Stigmatella ashevillensis TaxID=2995309 RepID=A0ABT5D3K5_9BACT|nr:hypothetical protein [Stigmatella ashevillena]MDC0708254.1 hypothetical protein [Stigmatella ashevillena]
MNEKQEKQVVEAKKLKLKIDPKSFRFLTNVEASKISGGLPTTTDGTSGQCNGSTC